MGVSRERLTVTAGQDNMEAAVALAETLASNGYAAHPMRMVHSMLGIATIHIHHDDERDEVILVETGDVAALRESVTKLQQMPASSPVDWALASPLDIPTDVDLVMGGGPIATLNHQWTLDNLVPLTAKLETVSAIAENVSAALEKAGHGAFDVDGGVQTLRSLDALISTLRPAADNESLPEGALPLAYLVGLGILATETARRAFGGGTLGRLTNNFTSFEPCKTVAEANGFPVLALESGHALQFAGKVHRRHDDAGDESLVELFERSSKSGASGGAPSQMDLDGLDKATGLGGALLNDALAQLSEEGEVGMPTAWSLIDGKITISRLMAKNSEHAEEMMAQTWGKNKSPAEVGMTDVFMRDHITGERTDAIAVYVAMNGVEVVSFGVPYVMNGGTPTFPQGVWATPPLPTGYPLERAAQHLLGADNRYGLTTITDAIVPASPANTGESASPSASDDTVLRKLAALAPFSIFLMVGTEGGKLHQGRGKRFAQALFEETSSCPALIQDVVGEIALAPDKRFEMVARNQDLLMRSLAALGVLAKESGDAGEGVFDWMTDLAAELSKIDGEIDMMKNMAVMAGLSLGREEALKGGDPFDANNRTATDGQLSRAGDAIVGGFIMVAIADGSVDKEEIDTFLSALVNLSHPLLVRMRDASGDPRPVIEKQMQDPGLIMVALQSAYTVFEQEEGGAAARRELMALYREVAFADGDVHEREQMALDIIQDVLFDGSTSRRPAGGVSITGYVLILLVVALVILGGGIWACTA